MEIISLIQKKEEEIIKNEIDDNNKEKELCTIGVKPRLLWIKEIPSLEQNGCFSIKIGTPKPRQLDSYS